MNSRPYNAPILTDIITVDNTGTTIDCSVAEYVAFIFENQGDKQLGIVIGTKTIKLDPGMIIELEQDDVISFEVKCLIAGQTTDVFYFCQGFNKILT